MTDDVDGCSHCRTAVLDEQWVRYPGVSGFSDFWSAERPEIAVAAPPKTGILGIASG
jgi:hypothetical protein